MSPDGKIFEIQKKFYQKWAIQMQNFQWNWADMQRQQFQEDRLHYRLLELQVGILIK